jgi:GNAT superfamily N-acetyltransferase
MSQQQIVSLADRPDLWDALWSFSDGWPPFMLYDPAGELMPEVARHHPELQLLLLDDNGDAIAKAMSVPFPWDGSCWDALPDRGWDDVLERAVRRADATAVVSALEISIRPELRGTGLSSVMLAAMRDAAAAIGAVDLVAPVRPSAKSDVPLEPISSYARRTRDDGLPVDPWMRVHARAGASVVKVAPLSMVVPGTLADWRQWTGLPFDRSGPVVVAGALVPVHVDVDNDHAVYVEPNVWMHHRLA